MTRELFVDRDFKPSSLAIIEQANAIIGEYQAQGFTLTLRQLYYQFVARDLLPNKQSEYKRLGAIINDGRLAGLIDWDAIEDRTRNVRSHSAWSSVEEIVEAIAEQYREDPWLEQNAKPEVWIEKDALIGVIEPVCLRYHVPYFACRGYTSQSEAYSAGKRFEAANHEGRRPVVLHLGDHDPSGLDMTRDNGDRVRMFSRIDVEVVRLALNWNQIEQYSPPPNPAKDTDARFAGYAEQYGEESWELDALDPTVIDGLIAAALEALIEPEAWKRSRERERAAREQLARASQNWSAVTEWLEDRP